MGHEAGTEPPPFSRSADNKDLWIIGGFRTDHGPCMLLAGFQWEV